MNVGHIEVEPEGGISVLALYGEHDLSTAAELREEIERVAGSGRDVIVDLTNAEFIDSSIIGVLVAGHRDAGESRDADRPLIAVAAPGGPVARLFELVSISELITVYPTRREALAAANGSSGQKPG